MLGKVKTIFPMRFRGGREAQEVVETPSEECRCQSFTARWKHYRGDWQRNIGLAAFRKARFDVGVEVDITGYGTIK
jgi:hypothetical protein